MLIWKPLSAEIRRVSMYRCIRFVVLCAALCFTPLLFSAFAVELPKPEAVKPITSMGVGFLVWESNRSGRWRIYRIELDGTNFRQISPEEADRDHYCPHLSPDGTQLVYLSYPANTNTYQEHKEGVTVPMHIMSSDGKSDRILIDNARAYGEDRAVVWVNDNKFHFIDGTGIACEYTISTGTKKQLATGGLPGFGLLVNATKTFATTGWPAGFGRYDQQTQQVSAADDLGGCQPFFTHDGVWGFWMKDAGGPINKINLATGAISSIIEKADKRMPKDRNYLYFPMVSKNQRLFAFGASPNQHDHFESDYDIFVAPIDPLTLEITSNPVRYTFDPGCDRYPDVYIADLELGTFKGEAPFTVKLAPKDYSQSWSWDFGDGSTATGKIQSHKFVNPGTYSVTAKLGDKTVYGRVTVDSARSPEALSAFLTKPNEAMITFSEPVNLVKAKFVVNNQKVQEFIQNKDRLSVLLKLKKNVVKGDQVRIEGIVDMAQTPNKMAVKVLDIKTYVWPSNKQNLVMLWDNVKSGCRSGSGERYTIQAIGRAAPDASFRMRTAGGNYLVTGVEDKLLKTFQKNGKMTIEFTVTTESLEQDGPARIITFSSGTGDRNFTVGQAGSNLIFRLRTPATGTNGVSPETTLCSIPANKQTHIVITYQPGELICYLNGKQVIKTDKVQGDFSNWTPQHFMIGDEWEGQRQWHGTLEGIALYDRVFSSEEAARNYTNYTALHPASTPAATRVSAKLIATSPVPTLEMIKPYREGLVLNEYQVEKVLEGKLSAKKIRVTQWAILGGQVLNVPNLSIGSVSELTIEPFEQNTQLSSTYMSDKLEIDPDIPLYYDINW